MFDCCPLITSLCNSSDFVSNTFLYGFSIILHAHSFGIMFELSCHLRCVNVTLCYCQQAVWCSSNILDLFSGGTWFKSGPGYQPFWMRFSWLKNALEWPMTATFHILPIHHPPSSFHVIWWYLTSAVKTSSLNNLQISQSSMSLLMNNET